jgi:hypothetical protein
MHRAQSKSRRSSSNDGTERKPSSSDRAERQTSSSREESKATRSRSKSIRAPRQTSGDKSSGTRSEERLPSTSPTRRSKSKSPDVVPSSGQEAKSRRHSSQTSDVGILKVNSSPSDAGKDVSAATAVLQTIAGLPELDISPNRRLNRHLGKHSSPRVKSFGEASMASGSSLSKTSRQSNVSSSSSGSSSTKEMTQLTPGALSRIQSVGISAEQLALLSEMGLTISEKEPEA